MLPCAGLDVAIKAIEQFPTLRGQKSEQSEGALLQRVVGKQPARHFVFVRVYHSRAKTFGAAGFRTQAVQLVEYFFGCRVERAQERLIELCDRLAQAFDESLDRLFAFVKARSERLRQRLGLKARAQLVAPLKNLAS